VPLAPSRSATAPLRTRPNSSAALAGAGQHVPQVAAYKVQRAISFGTAALPALAMRMAERGAAGLLVDLAPALFVAANVVFALLVAGTLLPLTPTPAKA